MPESSENSSAAQPPLTVTSPVAARLSAAPNPALGGFPETGKEPPDYKGPTVALPKQTALQVPKLRRLKLKPEAMGYHSQSGYQAPGSTFIGTEAEALELGERVEDLGEAEEGASHTAGDPENPTKNKPAGVETMPGGQTPV